MGLPIIGGTQAELGQYPSVVAILVDTHICTGTIIDRDWVLTAAHCVLPSEVGLATQLEVTDHIRVYTNTVSLPAGGTENTASLTIAHPMFDPMHYGAYDIGLIKLSKPVSITPSPVNRAPIAVGIHVTHVGFGLTRGGAIASGGAIVAPAPPGGSTGTEYVLADQISTACAPFSTAENPASDDKLLCFDQSGGKGICDGDSGGPAFDSTGAIVAFTSFGDTNCTMFGAHTRTDVEYAFIREHVRALDLCSTDDECLGDRECVNGHCIAAPFSPTGVGTECETGADCESGLCQTADRSLCSIPCTADDMCPDGFTCLQDTACWPADASSGGCCDSGSAPSPFALFALLALRRRR